MTACGEGASLRLKFKVPHKKKRQGKRSPCVQFKEQPAAIHVIEGYHDFAADAWYKRSEYMQMKRDVRSMALQFRRSVEKGIVLEDRDNFCLRGIEELAIPSRRHFMTLSRFESLVTVFDSKELEKAVGPHRNSIELASILGVLNRECTDEARQRAFWDAEAARLV